MKVKKNRISGFVLALFILSISVGCTSPQKSEEPLPYRCTYSNAEAYLNNIGLKCLTVTVGVENTSDCNLYLASSALDIASDGEILETLDYVFGYPEVIKPGETGYYYGGSVNPEKINPDTVLNVVPHLNVKPVGSCSRLPVENIELSYNFYNNITASGVVRNTLDSKFDLVWINIILFDSDNLPLGICIAKEKVLAPGDAKEFEAESHGMIPPTVKLEAVAHYRAYAYPH